MIARELVRRGITEIVHFTSNHGVVGMLATGHLLSTKRLRSEQRLQYVAHMNSLTRAEEEEYFDKTEDWIDFISFSLSEINFRYFKFSRQRTRNRDLFWALLAFDPEVTQHESVYFTTTNNSYEHCDRKPGLVGFNAMFEPHIQRKGDWRAHRRLRQDHLATCEQAEILYPCSLSLDFLRTIYVAANDDHDRVAAWLKQFGVAHVTVEIAPAKFNGVPN